MSASGGCKEDKADKDDEKEEEEEEDGRQDFAFSELEGKGWSRDGVTLLKMHSPRFAGTYCIL